MTPRAALESSAPTLPWTEADTRSSIHEKLERQVRTRPDHPAIAGPGGTLTYADLDQLCRSYQGLVLERCESRLAGSRIALLLDHGPSVVAGILAATRCGAVAVCLNPSDPPSRLAAIRQAVEPSTVLLEASEVDRAREAGFPERQQIVALPEAARSGPSPGRAPEVRPDDLAYLVCTSGTTAQPKLVMQTHRNVLHNVLRYTNGLGLRQADRVGWFAAPSGGQGMATTWSTLLNGATLCPFPIAARGIGGIERWLAEHEVTVLDTLPSVLRNVGRTLGDRRLEGVRLVRLASEAARVSDLEAVRRHLDETAVVANVLASSEAGIIAQALFHPGDTISGERLPVGNAAEGIELSVVDETGAAVETDATGEIVVRSAYLSPGYWRNPVLTSQRFEDEGGGKRAFRTGDLAERTGDGSLTVVGRADDQVKIRGYQVRLDDVEGALAGLPGVAAAAVAVRHGPRGDARLTAYVIPEPRRTVELRRLRHDLRALVPSYAIPVGLSIVDAFPLTAHGKVDRRRLAEIEPPATTAPIEQRPSTPTEELLRSLWEDALDRESISIDDTFLDLGGDSLSAAVVAAAVDELFGHELDLGYFTANPSLAAMAEDLDRAPAEPQTADDPPLRSRGSNRSAPLSFAQESMWRQATAKGAGFNMAIPYRIRGELDVEALDGALGLIVRRHAILRTTFAEHAGEPTAMAQPAAGIDLRHEDLRRELDPSAHAAELVAREANVPFELEASPPLRLRLLQLADEEHQLVVVAHHLICDAPSWKIFFGELGAFYERALRGGSPPDVREPKLQFADYATWERGALQPASATVARDIAWWRSAFEGAPRRSAASLAAHASGSAGPSGIVDLDVPAEPSAALDAFGRSVGATFFMTRLAVFGAGVALALGEEDLLVDTYLTARRRTELLSMIGPLINRATLRLGLGPQASFRDWVLGVRETVVETSAHGATPFELLWQELGREIPQPRMRIKFEALYQPPTMEFGELEVEPLPRQYVDPWAFTLVVGRGRTGDRWRAVFDGEHDRHRVERFLELLQALAVAGFAHPNVPVAQLSPPIAER